MSAKDLLIDSLAAIVIIGIAVLTDKLLVGIVAILLLRILTELIDIRNLLETDADVDAGKP